MWRMCGTGLVRTMHAMQASGATVTAVYSHVCARSLFSLSLLSLSLWLSLGQLLARVAFAPRRLKAGFVSFLYVCFSGFP